MLTHGALPVRRACVAGQRTRTISRCMPSDNGPSPDKEPVQEALVEMLRVNIQSQRFRSDLDKAVDKEARELIETADEVKEEIDKLQELTDMRRNLAFGAAMADIDEKYRKLEEELKASRKQLEEDEADFDRFQEKVANDRNAGLVFKSLYADPELEAKLRKTRGQSSDSWTKMELKAQAEEAQRRARMEMRSPVRLYIYAGLTLILISASAIDLAAGEASWGQLLIYAMIAACLTWSAVAERKALEQISRDLEAVQRDSR